MNAKIDLIAIVCLLIKRGIIRSKTAVLIKTIQIFLDLVSIIFFVRDNTVLAVCLSQGKQQF